jgi:hypothetical protein
MGLVSEGRLLCIATQCLRTLKQNMGNMDGGVITEGKEGRVGAGAAAAGIVSFPELLFMGGTQALGNVHSKCL